MLEILIYHWATYVYLAQLLMLLYSILRTGLTPRDRPLFMRIGWDRMVARFAWPVRPTYSHTPDECPEANRITRDGPLGRSQVVTRLDADHAC
jgi:hypothetical protein